MPEARQAPQIQEVNLEAAPLKLGFQAIEDAYALAMVKQTFWNYEQYRSQNHDARWNSHDALYVGWLPPRNWEGTTTPRSSLGMQITFSQIEAAFPAIYQSIFVDDTWFKVVPEAGADPKEAQAIQGHLKYSLEHPRADYTGSAEIELELAIKQLLLHGNGGISVEWDAEAGHPRVEWVDIRDFYMDPGNPVPSVDPSRSVIRRKLLTIDELDDMRSDPRMKIPERAVLVHMSRNTNFAYADKTKQVSAALRGIVHNPALNEWSPTPSERKIECLVYYSKHRIIWVLNREFVAYNEKNPYGFIPFCFAPCFPLPGEFYALSYADVINNPQRYIEALYNGRLDGLALALRPPRVRKRGSILTPSQQRWAPGAVQEADDPSKDVAVLSSAGDVSGIMNDVAFLKGMVEDLTGVNSGGGIGTPRPGNANRTAAGMNLQAHGATSRIWPIVKHIEDYLIVPMLYKMYRLVQMHTYSGQLLPALGPEDQHIQVGADSFRKPVRFTMQASSKMLTREKLAQVMPFLTQYIMAGPFISGIQATGQTVDFEVFAQMLQDSTGTGSSYRLIRPMNQQEIQAKQTPPPQVMMQQQQAQADHQVRLQLMDKKVQGELQKEQLKKQPDPQQAQMEMMKTFAGLQADKQKAQLEQQQTQQKMVTDHLTNQQKLEHQRQAAQQKMFIDAALGQQKVKQNQVLHLHDMYTQGLQSQQDLNQSAEEGKQKIEQTKTLGDHKMKLDKQRFNLQARAMKSRPAQKKTA